MSLKVSSTMTVSTVSTYMPVFGGSQEASKIGDRPLREMSSIHNDSNGWAGMAGGGTT